MDHRATGALVIEAARDAGLPDTSVYLVESLLDPSGPNGFSGFTPAVSADDSLINFSTSDQWSTVTYLMGEVYTSQYLSSDVTVVGNVQDSGKTLSLKLLTDYDSMDSNYSQICP